MRSKVNKYLHDGYIYHDGRTFSESLAKFSDARIVSIISNFGNSHFKVSPKFLDELFRIPDFSDLTEREKSEALFCLATVCTRLSSVSGFGKPDGTSIMGLSILGTGLMQAALECCESVAGRSEKTMATLGKFFSSSCRALASESLLSLIKDNNFSNVKYKIIPPDWW